MLFLAGVGNTPHVFDKFAPKFTNDFRVLGLTRRGHGESEIPDTGYNTATRVEDIRQFLDALKIPDLDSPENRQRTAHNEPDGAIDSPSATDARHRFRIILTGTVTNIGIAPFLACASLTCIVVPDSVITIEEWAFFSSGLRTVPQWRHPYRADCFLVLQ